MMVERCLRMGNLMYLCIVCGVSERFVFKMSFFIQVLSSISSPLQIGVPTCSDANQMWSSLYQIRPLPIPHIPRNVLPKVSKDLLLGSLSSSATKPDRTFSSKWQEAHAYPHVKHSLIASSNLCKDRRQMPSNP